MLLNQLAAQENVFEYLSRAAGSSGTRRDSLVHILAVLPTREPWLSGHPLSYDAASPLTNQDIIFFNICHYSE